MMGSDHDVNADDCLMSPFTMLKEATGRSCSVCNPPVPVEAAQTDPLKMLDALEPFVETLRGLVAMLVSEGFTDREARALVTRMMTYEEEK